VTGDTILHSWEVLAEILQSEEAKDIVCDIGMSVGMFMMGFYYGISELTL
jgi:hypothetical protein